MKRRWLKVITLACATALSASLFVGCGGSTGGNDKPQNGDGGSTTKKELNIAVFEGGFGRAFWDEAKKAFEAKNPEVTVNIESNPKIGDLIRPKISAGEAPDFIYLSSNDPSGIATALIKDKGLEDLTDVFDREDPDNAGKKLKDKILPGFLDTPLTAPYGDNKVFLAPLYYNVTGLWYNKALFKEKGWEVPKTWDDFFALGEKAKSEKIALFAYQGQSPGYNEALMFPMLADAVGEEKLNGIYNYEDGAWENPDVLKALKVFEDIATKDMALNGTVGMNHTQAQKEFLDGKALFLPCGSWLEGEMKDATPEGFEFGFMAPPSFKEGNNPFVCTTIEQMYVPKEAKNKDLAKDFIAFLYTNEMVKKNAELAGAVVPVQGAVESAKQYIDASSYDAFKVVEAGATPLTVNFAAAKSEVNMRDSVLSPIGKVINKELKAEDWTKQLEKDSDKVRETVVK